MTQLPPVGGCIMSDSLYVKPNGDLPCWDDVGEELILRTLDEAKLIAGEEEPIVGTPELVEIRRAFRSGQAPHPSFCSRCAVYGHGKTHSLRPKVLNVLHVEPAYLCQLACPQCFLPKERLGLRQPPYYMTLDFYRALLDQLLREGIQRIRFVHFEGRGEPLLNQSLGEMAAATKERFPDSLVMATTHGNFPYRRWMHESGMDILRFSVDGAFAESYERYRVGGKLEKALDLMRAIRDHGAEYPDSPLRVEWKYILFEWNDSDEEMLRAHELAQELGVRLRFCLTHTPGRSHRFADKRELLKALDSLAPGAATESTFQLRQDPSEANAEEIFAEHAEALLLEAIGFLRSGRTEDASAQIGRALRHAPGLEHLQAGDWHDALDTILARGRHASTMVAMANVALAQQRWMAAERLFRRYLELAPEAPDRTKTEDVLIDLAVGNRLGCRVDDAALASPERRLEAERIALELDSSVPDHVLHSATPTVSHLEVIRRTAGATTLRQLALLRRASGDLESAGMLAGEQAPAEPAA